ncbi:cytidylyltransferase domain-containing protein [Escherichia albertii]|uniref:Predicted acylneuraminate cytidylyltransferase n=1 Tax=Escherichia albertii TaxID=208962 RepID=A0A5A4U4F8_ESCAL|nr:GDSL-type esterase/lipase family protein [Escherichia albertii]MCZ9168628.1 GDSL-type esterase/lipase family protein [Escherichia albertii]BBM62835.1 predicted acylneuraminate cytidylyltransferase [Escherichia albertii]
MSKKKIAIIPARAGSKGLPNKNILMLLDRPLIAYTIDAAVNSNLFDKVIVSTDSERYKAIAEYYGAEVMLRSTELSSDTATSYMVVEDVLKKNPGYEIIALLQPTSPFRTANHIKQSMELFEETDYARFLVSVSECFVSADLIKPLALNGSLENFDKDFSNYRRQNCKQYSPNGAIFLAYTSDYLKQKHFFGSKSIAYIMNKEDSIDIDDHLDFYAAIALQSNKSKIESIQNVIYRRINEKKEKFNSCYPITLIGHSIFDYWDIEYLNGKIVNNLGIAGINSEQYYTLILESGLIKSIGDIILLMTGTNDLLDENWTPNYTLYWINKTIQFILNNNHNAHIYFLATPPIRDRIDRSNSAITRLNKSLEENIKYNSCVTWVPFSDDFYDEFGYLKIEFTNDGVHFNKNAYQYLEKYIQGIIK